MLIFNLLISSLIQIILFSALPFIWWFIKKRKQTSFFLWIGLKKPIIKDKKKYLISIFFTLTLFLSISIFIPIIVDSLHTATSQFDGQGIIALLPAIIYSFLQTGLSEEIFFRGFLMRVLVDAFGFNIGNFIQGLLFGVLHGVLFFQSLGLLDPLLLFSLQGLRDC